MAYDVPHNLINLGASPSTNSSLHRVKPKRLRIGEQSSETMLLHDAAIIAIGHSPSRSRLHLEHTTRSYRWGGGYRENRSCTGGCGKVRQGRRATPTAEACALSAQQPGQPPNATFPPRSQLKIAR